MLSMSRPSSSSLTSGSGRELGGVGSSVIEAPYPKRGPDAESRRRHSGFAQPARAHRVANQVGAIAEIELGHGSRLVRLERAVAEAQAAGHFFGGVTVGHQPNHLDL